MDTNILQAIKSAAYNIGNAYYSENQDEVTNKIADQIAESLKCWLGGDRAISILTDLATALQVQADEI